MFGQRTGIPCQIGRIADLHSPRLPRRGAAHCAHRCATAPPRLTSKRPGPPPSCRARFAADSKSRQIDRRMSALEPTTNLTTTTPILPEQRTSAGCFSYPFLVSDVHIRKVPVFAITDSMASPLARNSKPVLRGARRRGASIPALGGADRAGAVADHRARLLPVCAHCAGCGGRGEAYQDESTAEGLSVRSIHPSSSRIPDSFSSDRTPPSNGSRSRWDGPLRDPHRNRADSRARLRVSSNSR